MPRTPQLPPRIPEPPHCLMLLQTHAPSAPQNCASSGASVLGPQTGSHCPLPSLDTSSCALFVKRTKCRPYSKVRKAALCLVQTIFQAASSSPGQSKVAPTPLYHQSRFSPAKHPGHSSRASQGIMSEPSRPGQSLQTGSICLGLYLKSKPKNQQHSGP